MGSNNKKGQTIINSSCQFLSEYKSMPNKGPWSSEAWFIFFYSLKCKRFSACAAQAVGVILFAA